MKQCLESRCQSLPLRFAELNSLDGIKWKLEIA